MPAVANVYCPHGMPLQRGDPFTGDLPSILPPAVFAAGAGADAGAGAGGRVLGA